MKKYNVKEIMKAAWEIRRSGGATMSEAMKTAWSVAKIKVGVSQMDDKVQEYFRRLEATDKAMKALEEIKAEIQAACLESPDSCIPGFGWNASYKPVTSNRFDSKEFKAAGYADLYNQYSHPTTTRRFLVSVVCRGGLTRKNQYGKIIPERSGFSQEFSCQGVTE